MEVFVFNATTEKRRYHKTLRSLGYFIIHHLKVSRCRHAGASLWRSLRPISEILRWGRPGGVILLLF